MARETISFKGDKEVWQNFTLEAKRRKQEIWNILEPFIRRYSSFEHEKIKMCTKAALEEYYRSRLIDKLLSNQEVPDTDGNFTQIGHRPLIEKKVFQKDKDRVYRSSILPSIGSVVADAEVNFLVGEILKNQKIPKHEIDASIVDINFLSSEAMSTGHETSILIPFEFYSQVHNDKDSHIRIKHENPEKLDDHNLIFLHKEILGNKIIIVDKSSTILYFVRSYNPITDKSEILHIEIGISDVGEKTDILVRTLIKLKIFNPLGIKIFDVKNMKDAE